MIEQESEKEKEASQMLVEYKKCNASSWNSQAATLTALLAVSVAQNSECVGLGIPRWHCVQEIILDLPFGFQ